jgi:hypothetical protein
MRIKLLLAALLLASVSTAQITVTRIKRQIETSSPQESKLDLRRGETVDFDMQFLSYGTVMDITAATVVLHATTNGMPEGTSFQISGTAGSNGTASVRISVDDWLPYTLTSGTWTLECASPNAPRIMRASGTVKVSGLYYPSTNSPIPVMWATNFLNIIAGKVSATDATYTSTVARAAAAFAWGPHADLYLGVGWQPAWTNITGMPLTFAPSAHSHDYATTNNVPAWDLAASYGPHAGLYLLLGWQPAWTNIVGIPSTFPPSAHNQSHTTITDAPWTVSGTVSNIVNYLVGVHDALSSAHATLFGAKLDSTNATYLATVLSASTAVQPAALLSLATSNDVNNVSTNLPHANLTGRSDADQHLIGSITDLTATLASKADTNNLTGTIVISNIVVTGSIQLGDLNLKWLKVNGTNGLVIMQPQDANEYMIWLPPAPQ